MTEIGEVFGRLTIIDEAPRDNGRKKRFFCKCKCGTLLTVDSYQLKSGHSKSCGCLKSDRTKEIKTTHGLSKTKTYRTWSSMIDRCRREKSSKFYLYGKKGIEVCSRWLQFENFVTDMGHRPDGLTIDRIDNTKGYYPDNCRWANAIQQANNRRTTRIFTFNGDKGSLRYFSTKFNLSYDKSRQRIASGWTLERTFSTS